jgi:hypothetical protein
MPKQMKGFFAYPGDPIHHAESLKSAIALSNSTNLRVIGWESLKIFGLKVDRLIREKIAEADVLFADITYSNFNVIYEIGFAIGKGKIAIPTICTAVGGGKNVLHEIGLLDTIGQIQYENSVTLSERMSEFQKSNWSNDYLKQRNYQKPLFVLDTIHKTDFRNHIFQGLDSGQLNYRTYDPVETPRFTAAQAIAEVSASVGTVIPLLGTHMKDSQKHNLRAAFVAGLSHGMDLEPLIIQLDGSPAPLDYRDFIANTTFRHETLKHVTEYCERTLPKLQNRIPKNSRPPISPLNEINIGSPTAENETDRLCEYFLETAEFQRAARAEAAVVVGRKGSGKTAIFFQLLEKMERNKNSCILDMRPASHNLSEIRVALLEVQESGIFDHTISAFWTAILYREIVLHMRALLLPRSRNDYALQSELATIEIELGFKENDVSGDFTSRLATTVNDLVSIIKAPSASMTTREAVTNILFISQIPKLREITQRLAKRFKDVVILIDDLDKGWPVRRVESHDAQIIKHLIEVLYKIQREMTKADIRFRHLIFIRSDMYEQLVENTADRGKYNPIRVNWSDRSQLSQLLTSRIESNGSDWLSAESKQIVNPTLLNGETVFDRLIDHSLMRPRFLVDIFERTISVAANRVHSFVTELDVDDALRQMSLYLCSDFAYEMRDVFGVSEDIIYAFIGCEKYLSEAEVIALLRSVESDVAIEDQITTLLWYGCLGLWRDCEQEIFIYNLEYDFRRLEAERNKMGSNQFFVVNSAFFTGLS